MLYITSLSPLQAQSQDTIAPVVNKKGYFYLQAENLSLLKKQYEGITFPELNFTGRMNLQEGRADERIPLIKRFLALTGDMKEDTSSIFNPELKEGIIRFQERNGLNRTGNLDKETLTQLKIPIRTRLQIMEQNIAQFESLSHRSDPVFILVNIPDFHLRLMEENKEVLKIRSIVGKPSSPTPVFDDIMEYVVINPSWEIPRNITTKELLPKMRNDRSYAARNGIKALDTKTGKELDLQTVLNRDPSTFRLQQPPGARNPLGKMKFIFPNKYNVYIHDTPNKNLFNRDNRVFSHGCIRIEKPFELFNYVIKNEPEWKDRNIDDLFNSKKSTPVTLSVPLPVYINYFTSWVDEKGRLNFRKDVYSLK